MKRFLLKAIFLINISFLAGCSITAMGMSAYTQTQIILVQEKMIFKDKGIMFDLIQDTAKQLDSQSSDYVRVNVIFVRPQSDAEKAGLQKGDEITLINGQNPSNSNNIINLFFDRYDNPIEIKVKRNETEFDTSLMPL